MAETHFLPDSTGSTKRPDVITVTGIFTFINTGLFTLIYLFGIFGMRTIAEMPVDEFIGSMKEAAAMYIQEEDTARLEELGRILHANGVTLMVIFLVRTVVRLVGMIGMWKGRKQGFYTYAAAQCIGLFAPLLVLPLSYLGFFGPLMTVAVTALYGSQLKRMS